MEEAEKNKMEMDKEYEQGEWEGQKEEEKNYENWRSIPGAVRNKSLY
jgi:hypothetical protein